MLPRLLRSLTGLQWVPRPNCVTRVFSGRAPGYVDQDMTDPYKDSEFLDPGEELEALFKEATRKQKANKFYMIKRQMTPRGPPARKLTWDAIEQIRYLKQEFPEEWTLDRLAEGFSVSPDVIARVLRSKFTPLPERRARQDARVSDPTRRQLLLPGHQPAQDRLGLPGGAIAALDPPGRGALAALPSGKRTDGHSITSLAPLRSGEGSPISPALLASRHPPPSKTRQTMQRLGHTEEQKQVDEPEEEEEEDSWSGLVLLDQELEELAETFVDQDTIVVKRGNEFFDSKGNFLYRL